MKELSIEEKAKRYDEAFERARYWEKNPTVWSSDDICQKLFPELADSEDERIRKELIRAFQSLNPTGVWNGIKRSNIIAWLEKQGNKESLISQHENKTCKESDDSLTGEDEKIRKSLSAYFAKFKQSDMWDADFSFGDIVAWFEKQGELERIPKHKTGDTVYYNSFGGIKSMIVANIVTDSTDNPMYEDENGNTVFEKDLIEHKSAECRQEAKPNGGIVYENFNDGDGYYKVNLAYLSKSQVELIELLVASWQNPTNNTAEWSKEVENNILFLTSIIEECFKDKEKITLCSDTVCANFTKENVIDRLKSLRPQPTWKPSDEQIKVCKEEKL